MERVPRLLLRSAFVEAGEKNFLLTRMLYPLVLGRDWDWAVLGFTYLKCLDNAVDEDSDAERAKAVLDAQWRVLERAYGGDGLANDSLPRPECYGFPFFCFDRRTGSRMRPHFEATLQTMEFDLDRRGRVLSRDDLQAYMSKAGGAAVRCLAGFLGAAHAVSDGFVQRAGHAYLWADNLIDLEHDLGFGIINVPREDLDGHGIVLGERGPALRLWLERESEGAEAELNQAIREAGRVSSLPLRLMGRLYLTTKRRKLRRFLQQERLRAPSHVAGR